MKSLTPERIEILRRMTPEEKWNVALEMYWAARRSEANRLRNEHPDWNEEGIQVELRRIFLAEGMKEG